MVGWADLVIDEVNTVPFFAKFYVRSPSPYQGEGWGEVKNILFVHQLCRQIWFYEMFFPLNLLGYILEPIYLWLLRDRKVITVSQSTKNDLLKYGFKEENIKIISEGIEIEPLPEVESRKYKVESLKYEEPTILSLGAIRSMKRIDHIIKAFELAKEKMGDLRLVIVGSVEGEYGKKVLKMIKENKYQDSIEYLGKISKEKKIEILQKAHLLAVTSVKEGWGLVITEANSQGTPAVVYNMDGLRDAVKNDETGIICQKNTPENLAENMTKLLGDKAKYEKLSINAWEWSKGINFEKSYEDFINFIT